MGFTSNPSVHELLCNPGYLFINPSSLANEAGWGTKLGYCEKGIEIKIDEKYVNLPTEETGEEFVYRVYTGTNCQVVAILKNYNATVLTNIFPGLGGTTFVKGPNTILSGSNLLNNTCRILYVPEDTTNCPVFLGQKTVASVKDSVKYRRADPLVFIAVFDCFRKTNDSDGMFYIGLLAGGTLR